MAELNYRFTVLLINPGNKQRNLIKQIMNSNLEQFICSLHKKYFDDSLIAFWNFTLNKENPIYAYALTNFFNQKHAIIYLTEKNEINDYLKIIMDNQKEMKLINPDIKPLEIAISLNGLAPNFNKEYPSVLIRDNLEKTIEELNITLKELYPK